MATVTPSQPSGNGADLVIGTYTYIVRYFDSAGYLFCNGTIEKPDEFKAKQLQSIKEKTGGVAAGYTPTSASTIYEIVQYYYNELHLTDVMAIRLLLDYPVTREETPKNGYKAGNRFLTSADIYSFARAARDGKLVYNTPVDWNSWITAKITYEAQQAASQQETNEDKNSPYNPNGPYYDPEGKILKYDKEKGFIIYQAGKIVDTNTGLTYIVEAQGSVTAYDAEKGTVTYESGAVLDLKTWKLTTKDGVIQVIEQNPEPWYFKVFGRLLTDTTTQLIAIVVIALLLYLKKMRNEQS